MSKFNNLKKELALAHGDWQLSNSRVDLQRCCVISHNMVKAAKTMAQAREVCWGDVPDKVKEEALIKWGKLFMRDIRKAKDLSEFRDLYNNWLPHLKVETTAITSC